MMTPAELKSIRYKLNLSQSDLAAFLKYKSDRSIRRWENGTQDIPGAVVMLLTAVYNCYSCRELLGLNRKNQRSHR